MPKSCPVCGVSYADNSVFCPTDGTTLRADDRSVDLVGSVIADRYLVSSLLGEGGMGRVYLARHVRLPQQAAIKVLHPGMVSDPEAVARFNREAANAARIEHDRVARVFDFGETRDGSVYLAMEYVPGRTLRAILESGPLLPTRAAHLTFQVAEGLDAAHRMDIVHRDLKPDNIMVVTDDAGVDRCKVVDFGIAKAADAGQQTRLTRTGTVVGTPEFMSPEQVLGEAVDARSDVYALALVAYNMFTGALPFSSTTPERAFAARLIEDPRPLRAAMPQTEWPAELQHAFDRALDKDPANRTPSALEFADAVVTVIEGWTGAPVLRSRTPVSTRRFTPGPLPAFAAAPAAPADTPRSVTAVAPRVLLPSPAVSPPLTPAPAAIPARTRASRTPWLFAAGGLAIAAGAWALFSLTGGTPSNGGQPESGKYSSVPADPGTLTTNPPASRLPAVGRGAPGATRSDTTSARNSSPVAGSGATAESKPGEPGPPTPAVAAAKHELDSVRNVLEDPASDEAAARAAIPTLQQILRGLATATDSTWAYLALASAHLQASEPLMACNVLRKADRLATTDQQRRAVKIYFNETTCVP